MTWLLCDYGEVLSLAQPIDERLGLVAASGCDESSFWSAYWEHRGAYDRADLTALQYWTRVLQRAPDEKQFGELIERDVASWLHVNEVAVAAAGRAGQRGYRLALLSNAPIEIADAIDRLPALTAFEPRLFSCRLREVKPNPAIYLEILDRLQARPEEIVFFDDRQVNVDAALSAGIRAHHFSSASQFDSLPSV